MDNWYVRKHCSRRIPPVPDFNLLPEWIGHVLAAAFGALGTIVVGVIVATKDNKRIRSDDRNSFMEQLLSRVKDLEDRQLAEQDRCDRKLAEQKREYEAEIEKLERRIFGDDGK